MKVLSIKGTRCPKEGKPREYITDSTPVEVSKTPYYSRLVAEGSLVIAPETEKAKKGGKE